MNTVTPSSPSMRNRSRNSRIPAGSRPFAGSSRTRRRGRRSRATPRPKRWRIPCEYDFTFLLVAASRPTVRRTSSTRASRASRSARGPESRAWYSRLRPPDRYFTNAGSSTSAPTRRSARCRACSLPPWTGSPRTSTSPPVGKIRPRAMRMVVVFPAPFGPRKP